MKLSLKGSLLAAILLLIVLLILNSTKYVNPDFISISIGSLGGYYFGGWILWLVFKNFVSEERVDKKFAIFAVAAALVVLNVLNTFLV